MSGVILVVDDDVALRRSLCESLEEHGYVPAAASDGADARRWLLEATRPPRLILLDIAMRLVDGGALLRWLRATPRFAAVPVIVVSAVPSADDLARELGATACLKKPFPHDALLDVVGRVLATT